MTDPAGDSQSAYTFERTGRSRLSIFVVSGIWAVLVAAVILVDAAPWLMALVGAFTLPAVWEIAANPRAGLRLGPQAIEWYSGKRRAEVAWHEVDHIRFDTRLDFSVRASAVVHGGRKFRLPAEATPPHAAFEDALTRRGIKTERHHFSLL